MHFSDFDRRPNSVGDGWLERLSIRGGRSSSVNNEDNPTITELSNRSGHMQELSKNDYTYSLAHLTGKLVQRVLLG